MILFTRRYTSPDVGMMDAFEQLVFSQKPAEQPWEPVTDYSFEGREPVERPHAQLIRSVFDVASALDYGCGFGHLVSLLREYGIEAKGYDPNLPPREQMRPNARPNVTSDLWGLNASAPFPLVICREVLEHLTLLQIRRAVTNLCALSSRFVYVTTRFSSEHDILRVETKDDLDPTHITIPSKDLIRLLFVLEGFKRRADLETRMDWQGKGRCLVYERA